MHFFPCSWFNSKNTLWTYVRNTFTFWGLLTSTSNVTVTKVTSICQSSFSHDYLTSKSSSSVIIESLFFAPKSCWTEATVWCWTSESSISLTYQPLTEKITVWFGRVLDTKHNFAPLGSGCVLNDQKSCLKSPEACSLNLM